MLESIETQLRLREDSLKWLKEDLGNGRMNEEEHNKQSLDELDSHRGGVREVLEPPEEKSKECNYPWEHEVSH